MVTNAQQEVPVNLCADCLRRTGIAHCQFVQQPQLPKQFVDEQVRDSIARGSPSDLPVHPQAQKRLRSNMDTRYSVKSGPSHEFHGGQVPPLWGWHCTSTLKEEEQKLNKLLSGL